jgi:D-alanyl-D-alanine dipeptidase
MINKNYLQIFFYLLLSAKFSFANDLPNGFVYLHNIDKSIYQKLGFSSNDNFVGVPLDGYLGEHVIITKEAALALSEVQKDLKKVYPNYSLQVTDAYRPISAVKHIQHWAKDLNDQKTKKEYYPDIDKKDLLGKFLAAKKSSHSRGSTFDVVIINEETGEMIDFGDVYFGDYVHINYARLTKEQRKNRLLLREFMIKNKFRPYDAEFWHFTLIDEPFPNEYFNFKIISDPTLSPKIFNN